MKPLFIRSTEDIHIKNMNVITLAYFLDLLDIYIKFGIGKTDLNRAQTWRA